MMIKKARPVRVVIRSPLPDRGAFPSRLRGYSVGGFNGGVEIMEPTILYFVLWGLFLQEKNPHPAVAAFIVTIVLTVASALIKKYL